MLQRLPTDVIRLILVSDSDTDNSLVDTCALVCKQWREALDDEIRWSTLLSRGIPTEERFRSLLQKLLDHPERAAKLKGVRRGQQL
ncbi:hypothetical protein BC629DRAFT_1588651 [Irpex lacteus]|nr:hypothetical protein BC629DRAFT_1588651 [Irpex lacteus]